MTNNVLRTSKRDVIWNYVGTLISMGSNFVLLPMLLAFLSTEQIGLWYVFVALSGLSQLLEFGFSSTLSRNILFCLSGARRLVAQGIDEHGAGGVVNWHLVRVVLKTAKSIYAVIGIIALVVVGTVGSVYVCGITGDFSIAWSFPSWVVFIASVFTNLYFLYCLTYLRGLGDVAGENRAKTFARLGQLALTAVLLMAGLQLLAAAIGFLVYSCLLMLVAMKAFGSHEDVQKGLASDRGHIDRSEMISVLKTVSFVAWRDGVVSLAMYGATQATTLLCSGFFGLAESATYSVMLQLANAIANLSCAYARSFLPQFQSAFVQGDWETMRSVPARGVSCYCAAELVGSVGTAFAVLPVLALFKDDFICDPGMFLVLSAYLFLLNQHSLYCQLIVSMNEIPYFKAYIATTVVGIILTCLFCGPLCMGVWGLILGQALPQLCYNNWRWPRYVYNKIGGSYTESLHEGATWWVAKLFGPFKKKQ